MSAATSIGLSRLVLGIGVFVLVGVPMVAYLWETLNELFAGEVRPGRLLASLPVLILFAGLLALLSRRVRRWEAERLERIQPPAAP